MGRVVLVIDDEPEIVEMVASRLQAGGYQALKAVSGKEGIEKARQALPDVILLDIMMPEMDGYQTLRRLKQDDATKKIPVLMLTVRAWNQDIEKALQEGAFDYIVKPLDVRVFAEKVKKAIELGRAA